MLEHLSILDIPWYSRVPQSSKHCAHRSILIWDSAVNLETSISHSWYDLKSSEQKMTVSSVPLSDWGLSLRIDGHPNEKHWRRSSGRMASIALKYSGHISAWWYFSKLYLTTTTGDGATYHVQASQLSEGSLSFLQQDHIFFFFHSVKHNPGYPLEDELLQTDKREYESQKVGVAVVPNAV